jgi:hypothetical protein
MQWLYFVIISFIVLGIYGISGVILSFILLKTRLSKIVKDYSIFSKEFKTIDSEDFEKIKVRPIEDSLQLINYRQIIRGKDQELKINLISILSLNPTRENVLLIKEALFDKNEMIRILAANCLQKMEDYYIENITKLEKLIDEETDKNKLIEINFELAQFCDEYIYSTLIPQDIVSFYEEKMMGYFETAYQLSQFRKDIALKYIRACVRFNKVEKAEDLVYNTLKIYPDEFFIKFWLSDIYLKKKEYDKIKPLLESLPIAIIKKIPKIYNSYKWWIN